MRDFGNGVFGGTAEYYDKYRPGYPPKMFQDIVQFFGLDGRGELLDLGCGTGELALPLAKFFSSVLAIDPEPGMLGLGARKSLELGLANIQWRKGSSEDLKSLQRLFRLVALGQSFHWMDQETVINQLYGRIQPGGGLFIVGTAPITQNQPTTIKNELIKEMLIKYLGPQRRAGNSIYTKPPKPYRELLSCSKFNGYKRQIYKTKVVRNIDQELGNLYSMSWGRRAFFGSNIAKFEQEFRRGLAGIKGPRALKIS